MHKNLRMWGGIYINSGILYHHTVGGTCRYHKEKNSIQRLFDQTNSWLTCEWIQSFLQSRAHIFVTVKLSLSMPWMKIGRAVVQLHSLTSALVEMWKLNRVPQLFYSQGRTLVPNEQEAEWVSKPAAWTSLKRKKLSCPYRDSNPKSSNPYPTQSLCWLHYPGSPTFCILQLFHTLPRSISLVVMTMTRVFSCQTMSQKSDIVPGRQPCVAM